MNKIMEMAKAFYFSDEEIKSCKDLYNLYLDKSCSKETAEEMTLEQMRFWIFDNKKKLKVEKNKNNSQK